MPSLHLGHARFLKRLLFLIRQHHAVGRVMSITLTFLIVFRVDFKIALGMIAGRAYLGGLFANDDMAAVAALPHLDFAFSKDLRHFHIVQQGTVALLMMPFNGGNHAEADGQIMEALFVGRFGKAIVHIRPLVVFALGGGEQVLGGGADAVQLLKPQLGMLFFILGGFEEQRRNLLIAILLGLGGKVGIFVARLGIA